MVHVVRKGEGKRLALPGRTSHEIVSGVSGAEQVTFRVVEIDVPNAGDAKRGPHVHRGFEECIFVISGEGLMESESGEHPVMAGDTILVPAGELHVTQNISDEPLRLLCFFPVGDVAAATREFSTWADAKTST